MTHLRTTVGLTAVAAGAWTLLAAGAVAMPDSGVGLGAYLVAWSVTMAAMMLPSIAPLAGAHRRMTAADPPGRRALRSAALAVGYLTAWALVGLAAFFVAWQSDALGERSPGTAVWLATVGLVTAGAYQFSPVKDACLRRCRSPFVVLLQLAGVRGAGGDLAIGLRQGAWCAGCCWALMAAMVLAGAMSVAWMAIIAVVVVVEKTWRRGPALARVAGTVLLLLALATILVPGLASPLAPGSMEMMESRP